MYAYVIIYYAIGCGTGNYLVALSEYVGKVTGLELNEGMLRKAREKTAHLKNVELMKGDVTNMPYPDGHFDAICCNMVSNYLVTPCLHGYSTQERLGYTQCSLSYMPDVHYQRMYQYFSMQVLKYCKHYGWRNDSILYCTKYNLSL